MQKRKLLTEKRKITLRVEHKAYNKRLRQRYLHSVQLTFEDYVDYIEGYYKAPIQTQSVKRYSVPKVRDTHTVVETVCEEKQVKIPFANAIDLFEQTK